MADRTLIGSYRDDVIALQAARHTLRLVGKTYEVYYSGLNFTDNLGGMDLAYVRITSGSVHYHNLPYIGELESKYGSIDYVMTNHVGYQKWLAGGGKAQGWTHSYVEVKEILQYDEILRITIAEGKSEYHLTFAVM